MIKFILFLKKIQKSYLENNDRDVKKKFTKNELLEKNENLYSFYYNKPQNLNIKRKQHKNLSYTLKFNLKIYT